VAATTSGASDVNLEKAFRISTEELNISTGELNKYNRTPVHWGNKN
jgi:hypothetical protein